MQNAPEYVLIDRPERLRRIRVSRLVRALLRDSLTGTISLEPLLVDAAKAPVAAAGGISDARGIKLGAEDMRHRTGINETGRKLKTTYHCALSS